MRHQAALCVAGGAAMEVRQGADRCLRQQPQAVVVAGPPRWCTAGWKADPTLRCPLPSPPPPPAPGGQDVHPREHEGYAQQRHGGDHVCGVAEQHRLDDDVREAGRRQHVGRNQVRPAGPWHGGGDGGGVGRRRAGQGRAGQRGRVHVSGDACVGCGARCDAGQPFMMTLPQHQEAPPLPAFLLQPALQICPRPPLPAPPHCHPSPPSHLRPP